MTQRRFAERGAVRPSAAPRHAVSSQEEAQRAADSYARLYNIDRSAQQPEATKQAPSKVAYDIPSMTSYPHGLSTRNQQQPPNHNRRYAEHQSSQRDLSDYEFHETREELYEPPRLHLNTAPRIPGIRRADSAQQEDEEDEALFSPRRIAESITSFQAMSDAGAGWGSALISALQGHKMTEEQAAVCLQSHWRRHEAVVSRIARGLAANHIQNAYRERLWLRAGARIEIEQARRAKGQRDEVYWAATKINAAARGKLGRAYANRIRPKKSSTVLRSFSFSSRKKKAPSAGGLLAEYDNARRHSPAPAADRGADGFVLSLATTPRAGASHTSSPAPDASLTTPRGGGGNGASLAKRVRRSLSFDKKAQASGGSSSQVTALSCTRRTFVLERGPQGLGLELDATNTVVTVKAGGRAERQGLLCLGDTILTIDGKSCSGVLMQDVLVPGRPCYVVEVSRPDRCAPTPMKSSPANLIRRSLSFDSKKSSGGVKRTYSWDKRR